MSDDAAKILRDGAEIYESRSKEYGQSYLIVGKVMVDIFPNGIALETEDDFTRFHLFEWTVGKLVRYASQFSSGGHKDSIVDASVYSAILASVGGDDD